MNTLEAALAYREEGVSVIPVNGKVPIVEWGVYRERHATKEEIYSWFANTDWGIAAVCGRLSDLSVLDADLPAANDWSEQNANTQEIVRTPSGGRHYHCKFKDYPNRVNMFGIGLDYRSEGGLAVLPPSPGYEWVSRGSRGELGDILPKIEPPKREVRTYNEPIERLIERTRRYIIRIEGAVSGQGGHGRTFRVACAIADRLAHVLSPEEALPLIEEWNTKCEPVWTEPELLHKLKSAWSR